MSRILCFTKTLKAITRGNKAQKLRTLKFILFTIHGFLRKPKDYIHRKNLQLIDGLVASDAEAEAGSGSNFEFLWKQKADAEAVLKVLLPLPFLPNIM